MTLEFKGTHPGGDTGGVEHAIGAKAKRVVPGALCPAKDPADPTRSYIPVVLAIGAQSFPMEPNKSYRLYSSAKFSFVLGDDEITATADDIAVPAATPVIVSSDTWPMLSVFGTATVQVVEVL